MNYEEKLISAALDAAEKAYAPYSGFKVGAAILTGNGEIFPGSNVENASYGLTVCAERIALFKAVTAGERDLRKIVIFTKTDQPFYPCGACRQVLSEFNPGMQVIVVWNKGSESFSLQELLPKQFKISQDR